MSEKNYRENISFKDINGEKITLKEALEGNYTFAPQVEEAIEKYRVSLTELKNLQAKEEAGEIK